MRVDQPFPPLLYLAQEIDPFILLYLCDFVGFEDVGQLLDDVFAINPDVEAIGLPLAVALLQNYPVCFRHLFVTVALGVVSLHIFPVSAGLVSALVQTLLVLEQFLAAFLERFVALLVGLFDFAKQVVLALLLARI